MKDALLITVLVVCIVTDIKSRKIYNGILVPTFFLGVFLNLYEDGLVGLVFSLKGFLVGLGLLIIPFVAGGIGAGDVKLLAVIGAVKGSHFVFYTFLGTGVAGGIIAIFILIIQGRLIKTIKNLCKGLWVLLLTKFRVVSFGGNKDENLFPYGVAISLGVVAAYVMG